MLWLASLLLAQVAFTLALPSLPKALSLSPAHHLVSRASASHSFAAGSRAAASQKALAVRQGSVGAATDGSVIVAMEAQVQGVAFQFKISAPQAMLQAAAVNGGSIQGATASSNAAMVIKAATNSSASSLPGLNVLLHGDGGQSFFDFPNQAVQSNQLGVVVLAPNDQMFWGGGSGLQRTDGVLHSQLINTLVKNILPQLVSFDPKNVFFSGVSGGSLLLSGFFLPAHLDQFNTGALLACGGMAPAVDSSPGFASSLAAARVHFQSTTQELTLLQGSIPGAITAYERLALGAGASQASLAKSMTADASPVGGHCAFDTKAFVSGIQLLLNSYADVMDISGQTPQIQGLGDPRTPVAGNEQLFFASAPSTSSSSKSAGRG